MIVRKLDDLNRVVVPREYCKMMGLKATSAVVFELVDNGILIKPHKNYCILCGQTEEELKQVGEKYVCVSCIGKLNNQ